MATLALAAVAAGALTLVAPKPVSTTRPDALVGGGYTRVTSTPGPFYSSREPGLVDPMRDYARLGYSSPEFFYASKSKEEILERQQKGKNAARKILGKNGGLARASEDAIEETKRTQHSAAHGNGGGGNKRDNKRDNNNNDNKQEKPKKGAAAKLSPVDQTKRKANPSLTKRSYVKPPPALRLDANTPEARRRMNERSQQIKRDVCNNVVVQIALQYDASAAAITKGKSKSTPERVKKAQTKLAAMKSLVGDADKQATLAMASDFPIQNLEILRGYAATVGALANGIENDLYNPNPPKKNPPIGKDKKVAGDLLPLDYISGAMVNILSWSNVRTENGPPALTVSSTTDTSVSLGNTSTLQTQQFRISPVDKMPGAYTITDAVTGRFLGSNASCSRPQLVTQSSAKTLWTFRLVGRGMNSTIPVYLMKVFSPPGCLKGVYLSLNADAANDVVLKAQVDNVSEAQSWVIQVSNTQPFEENRRTNVEPPPAHDPVPSNKDLASLGSQQNAALNNSGTMTDSGNQSQATQNSIGDVTYSVSYDSGGNTNQQDGNMYGGAGAGYLWGGGGYSTGGFGASAGGPSLSLSGGSNMSDSANTNLSSRSQGLVDNSIKLGADSAKSLFETESADDAVRSFGLEAGWTNGAAETSAPSDMSAPPPPPAPPAPAAPSSPIPPTPTIVQTPPKKKKMPVGAIVALVLLVLLMIAGSWFGYRWWKNRKGGSGGGNKSNNTSSPPAAARNSANSPPSQNYENMYRAAAAQPAAAAQANPYS